MKESEQQAYVDRAASQLVADVERATVAWHPSAAAFTRALARQCGQESRAQSVIASLGCTCPSSVNSRIYRARTLAGGELPSPKEQLSAFRLLLALKLGRMQVSVKEIACRMEWGSPQSFGRHVKERTGLTARTFLATWTPEAFWEYLGHFMKWGDERWLTLDVMQDSPTPPAQLGQVVAERPPVVLFSHYRRQGAA